VLVGRGCDAASHGLWRISGGPGEVIESTVLLDRAISGATDWVSRAAGDEKDGGAGVRT
jgi:hypothetical protein